MFASLRGFSEVWGPIGGVAGRLMRTSTFAAVLKLATGLRFASVRVSDASIETVQTIGPVLRVMNYVHP